MKKILVVDDSKIISNVITRAVRNEYEIVVARNGKEAIEIVRDCVDDKISCVFLDLNMPKYDGFIVLDYFKENDLFRRIPVCIITGDVAKERIDRAFGYDIVDVLAKPFTFDKVREEVKKIVELSQIGD